MNSKQLTSKNRNNQTVSKVRKYDYYIMKLFDKDELRLGLFDNLTDKEQNILRTNLRAYGNILLENPELLQEIKDNPLDLLKILTYEFTTELTNICANKKDQIITDILTIDKLALYDEDSNKMVFTRKSNLKQSKDKPQNAFAGKVCKMIWISPDSSGFKDKAILRALKYAIENSIKTIEVVGHTRSVEATASRNIETAIDLVRLARIYNIELLASNDIRGKYGEIFILLVSLVGQSEWIKNANTQYYPKHERYLTALQTKDWSNLEDTKEELELIGLIRENGSHEKVITFIKILKRKSVNRY